MIDTLYFTALVLVSIRMFCFFILVPVFFPNGTPGIVKVGLALIMAYILMPDINYSSINDINNTWSFIYNCLNEVSAGLTLGFLTSLCFSMVRFAGNVMDMQVGFAMMNFLDPSSNSNTTMIERLLYWTSMVIFLIVDGHHMLIKSLIQSFSIIKLGNFFLTKDSIVLVFKAFIEYFNIAVQIAVPVVLIILFTDITMSLIARTVPQLNIMILGLPVKILVGLASFCFALPILIDIMEKSFTVIPDSLKGFYNTLPVILIFAKDDKTEEATPRKKNDARKKGQIAKSKEVALAVTLMASTIVIAVLGGYAGSQLGYTMRIFLSDYISKSLDYGSVSRIMFITVWRMAVILLPLILPILVMGVFANLMQTKGLISFEPLKPDFSKLNPINGFKRIFSVRSLMELFKDTLIIVIVGFVGYKFIRDNYIYILTLGELNVQAVAKAVGKLAVNIFFKVTIIMLIIAIIDYMFQMFQYKKDLKMSKQELKEEYKQDEGDPQIKGKIRQKQRQLAMRRMMQEVPKATVVVTNPTHIAVALKYEEGQNAPVLVAKGADAVAFRIKQVAKDNDVPIFENRSLARLIFKQVEINEEIPVEMYQAVAEILALVYNMR